MALSTEQGFWLQELDLLEYQASKNSFGATFKNNISGYYFLRDARALPRMDTVLDSALRIPDLFSNFFTKFYVSDRCILNTYKCL